MWMCREFWFLFAMGLFLIPENIESRAVNITNTWTLPQDGFSVFYRFFRDKISWFEADAVCQFHHANLVTVDNSAQFDASRAFLRELDVSEPVWIGLMRPQNSEWFTWSNSKPLETISGHWAESLPLIESPICAVIDPVRDFRWRAQRCGGPETASFLCEMNVPDWAVECAIEGVPALTIQYMADTGTVELSRDCGDEGVLHQVCRGRNDRERIIRELVCKNEVTITPTSVDLLDAHQQSLQIISRVPTDNNEDNNILIKINPEQKFKVDEPKENPVEKLIEQFNIDELMQADQPQTTKQTEIIKPIKKLGKKVKVSEKKEKTLKKIKGVKNKQKSIEQEELMMGDQPAVGINAIEAPLPHIKKSLQQDLKHQEKITTTTAPITESATTAKAVELVAHTHPAELVQQTTQNFDTTTSVPLTELTELSSISVSVSSASTSTNLDTSMPDKRTTGPDHPIHPSQSRLATTASTEEPLHTTHSKGISDDHFIPPMLLVKSHYTSTKSHIDDTSSTSANEKADTVTTQKSDESTTSKNVDLTTTAENLISTESQTVGSTANATLTTENSIATSVHISSKETETTPKATEPASEPSVTEHQIVEIKIGVSENPITFSVTTKGPTTEIVTSTVTPEPSTRIQETTTDATTQSPELHEQDDHDEHTTERQIFLKNDLPSDHKGNMVVTTSELPDLKPHYHPKEKNKFSNEENYQPYKPNRRRSLTKPETTTYLKKILG